MPHLDQLHKSLSDSHITFIQNSSTTAHSYQISDTALSVRRERFNKKSDIFVINHILGVYSYRSYIGKSRPLAFVDYGPILQMMDSERRKRAATYRRFVEAGISAIDAAFIDTKGQSRLCIGSDSYDRRMDALYEDLREGLAERMKEDSLLRRKHEKVVRRIQQLLL